MESALRDEINTLHASFCKGLADPNRLFLLYTLYEKPCTVNELADKLGLPQPTVSRHLRVLRERNMVIDTRQGQSVMYKLTDERIVQALDLLRSVMADQYKRRIPIASAFVE